MKLHKILGILGWVGLLASCSSPASLNASNPGPGMWLVPINHTDRYAPHVVVDDAWAGNVNAQSGGGKAACCLPGRKDWSKPVLVQWRWGREEDPKTKAIILAGENRSAIVSFPARPPNRLNKSIGEPWSTEDYMADEAYLCVILRTLDEVELVYSNSRSSCRDK